MLPNTGTFLLEFTNPSCLSRQKRTVEGIEISNESKDHSVASRVPLEDERSHNSRAENVVPTTGIGGGQFTQRKYKDGALSNCVN